MKKYFFSAMAGLCLAFGVSAQDKVLLTIDGDSVMQSEFLYIYQKNNQETAVDKKSMDEYLDLFVNFKLKVKEAEALGYDTTESFKKEFASYRKQAAPKYMEDPQLEDEMVRLSYDHMCRQRRVAHICVQCPMDADSATTARALAKIEDARVRVTTGKMQEVKKGKRVQFVQGPVEDFKAVAMEVSEDPNLQATRGEVGWIVPFRYVWSFEKAAYATEVGQVSDVFRTQYGFHIMLVEEERPYEEVHASHIMKMCNTAIDSIALPFKAEMMGVWKLATLGEDFAALAREHSQDKGSAAKGGDLGWFPRGRMVQPFEDVAFGMKEGEISEVFASRFGWHVVKMHGRRGVQPLDSIYDQLKKQMQRDERHQDVEKKWVEKLRREYNMPQSATRQEVLAMEDKHLEAKYPEFRHLVQEYHDGILLFDVSLKEVWDKATLDTTGLETFFSANKKNYKWDAPRWKGIVFYCKDAATEKTVKQLIKAANKDSIQSYIDKRMNLDSVVYVRSEKGLWKQGQSPVLDKLVWKTGDWTAPEEYPNVFILGKKIKNPEEYMDERGKVTSDYQDFLEKAWVEQLRAKHEVVIFREHFEELKAAHNAQ